MAQTTLTDNLLVDGSRDIEQIRVQGHTIQNEPLHTWENNDGTVVYSQISKDGNLQMGDDLLGWSTPDALIEAHRADTSTLKPQRGFHSLGQVSGTLNALVQWIVGELELRGSSAINALHTALRIRASNLNTGTPTANAELRGADIEVINEATASAAALTKATGLQVGVTNASGKTITDAVGLRVKMNNAGTITNPYSIFTEGAGVAHIEDYLETKRPASVPGTPATDFVRLYAKSDGKLYAKDWSGVEYDLTGGGGSSIAGICNGRLTLSSGVPISLTDVLAAATLYFTPFRANQVALYNGSVWALFPFAERSLSLSGLLANTVYDVFIYDNSGTLTLEAVAWNAPDSGSITSISNASPRVVTVASHTLSTGQLVTITGNSVAGNNATWRVGTTTGTTFQLLNLDGTNSSAPGSVGTGGTWQRADQNTTRATALALQDGVYVKSGATGRRYLGSFRTTTVSGQTEDSAARRLVWNYHNRCLRNLKRIDTTNSWTYATSAWRAANNDAANNVNLVVGVSEDIVAVEVLASTNVVGSAGGVGIGIDSLTINSADLFIEKSDGGNSSSILGPSTAAWKGYPGEGYHTFYWIEYRRAGTATFRGDGGFADTQSGLLAEVWS